MRITMTMPLGSDLVSWREVAGMDPAAIRVWHPDAAPFTLSRGQATDGAADHLVGIGPVRDLPPFLGRRVDLPTSAGDARWSAYVLGERPGAAYPRVPSCMGLVAVPGRPPTFEGDQEDVEAWVAAVRSWTGSDPVPAPSSAAGGIFRFRIRDASRVPA